MAGIVGVVVVVLSSTQLAAAAPPCLLPPVSGVVIDPFREPACLYCAGNRGLEIATNAGSTVVAAAAGVVGFAGLVVGTRYVVIDHGGGYRTTYGKLRSFTVKVGDRIGANAPLGVSGAATFFGLRLLDTYLDPRPHLGELDPRPQLVPIDGVRRRPAPSPRLRC